MDIKSVALSSSGAECKELCWSYWDCPSRSFGGLTNLGLPLALAGLFGIDPHANTKISLFGIDPHAEHW